MNQERAGKPKASATNCISLLVGISMLVLTIMIFVTRGSQEGFTCAGWYLSDSERESDKYRSFVDVDRGMFLFVVLIINAVTIGCMYVCCCCASVCFAAMASNGDIMAM